MNTRGRAVQLQFLLRVMDDCAAAAGTGTGCRRTRLQEARSCLPRVGGVRAARGARAGARASWLAGWRTRVWPRARAQPRVDAQGRLPVARRNLAQGVGCMHACMHATGLRGRVECSDATMSRLACMHACDRAVWPCGVQRTTAGHTAPLGSTSTAYRCSGRDSPWCRRPGPHPRPPGSCRGYQLAFWHHMPLHEMVDATCIK